MTIANPFYAARHQHPHVEPRPLPTHARLPRAPINGSPVPHLTSLYHFSALANTVTGAIPAIAAAT